MQRASSDIDHDGGGGKRKKERKCIRKFCFLKRLFYTKKRLYKVGNKVGTMKKIKNSEENK
jgi:hypothetical protein